MIYVDVGGIKVDTRILTLKFSCNLEVCRGACCTDSGSRWTAGEAVRMQREVEKWSLFLDDEKRKEAKRYGLYNPKCNGCLLSYAEDGGLRCSVHASGSYKPKLCRLYPIVYSGGRLELRPDKQCTFGGDLYVYEFLKEPLIERFGEKWYEELISSHSNCW